MTTSLVAAVISLCVANNQCETHSLRIEPRACGAHYRAEAPINGAWQPAEARVTCRR